MTEQTQQPGETQLEEAREDKEIFMELVESRGWKRLVELMAEQRAGREREIHAPLSSMLELPKQEFIKGELQGAQNVLGLPQHIINTAEALISAIVVQREQEEKADGN